MDKTELVEVLLEIASKVVGVDLGCVKSKRRPYPAAWARQMVMAWLNGRMGVTTITTAELVGKATKGTAYNHTNVVYAVQRMTCLDKAEAHHWRAFQWSVQRRFWG